LANSFKATGIDYMFLGETLGGKPRGSSEEVWVQGKLDYGLVSRLSSEPSWRSGIKELARFIVRLNDEGREGCLLCSEADPNNCHRSLVSFDLKSQLPDLVVTHLDSQGNPTKDVTFQKTLFRVAERESHYH
jgi:uncharacterized protein (DUF488 family)